MANYPRFSGYLSPQTVIELYESLKSWSNEFGRELDFRDSQVDGRPATKILTAVTVTDIPNPKNGDVVFAVSAKKYRGYVEGTGWVNFH
tara:strand:- start:126 stop:392 length:267 start_codon:yes stop_codon:yes gene_type:complete